MTRRAVESLEGLLDFLLPPACAGCAGYLPGEGGKRGAARGRICPQCRTRLRPPAHPRCPRCNAPRGTGVSGSRPCMECHDWPAVLRAARSAVVLRDPADALVHALKYGGWPELAGELAGWMTRLVQAEPALFGGGPIVPVPTTFRRLRVRGYNQARALGEAVAQRTGHDLVDALLRRDGGGSQVALQPGERRANVLGAFALSPQRPHLEAIRDRDVILVDDVLTTGATARAAAAVLAEGNARSVVLLTFARALPG